MKTVTLCYIIHNDLPMLRCTLPYDMRWADQVCILDMGSTDGLADYCLRTLREGDVYLRRDTNTVAELGFSEARNACSELATSDWVVHHNANMLLDWDDALEVKGLLDSATSDVLSVRTENLTNLGNRWDLERVIHESKSSKIERHRAFFRRGVGIDYKGYIHEELYRGEVNMYGQSENVPLVRYHFEGSGNHPLRSRRYNWMLLRAYAKEPALQKYTNEWWYQTYCKQNEPLLREGAAAYEEYVAVTGNK